MTDKYKGKCIACDHSYQLSTGTLKCDKYGMTVYKDDPNGRCYSYRESIRSDYDIEQMLRLYGKYFILTKIDNIFKENGKFLNNECFLSFVKVFEKELPKTAEGKSFIAKYNEIGPIIATKIDEEYRTSNKKKRILFDLENYYEKIIKYATECVKQGNYLLAIAEYKRLIYSFASRYSLDLDNLNVHTYEENKSLKKCKKI